MIDSLWQLSKSHPGATAALGTVVLAVVAVLQLLGVGTAISAAWKRFILGSADKEAESSGLEIPLEGPYGPNLLSGDIETASAGEDYSMSARAPKSHGIRVKVSVPSQAESSSGWSLLVGSKEGWRIGGLDTENYARDLRLPPDERGDVQLNFNGSGTLQIELYEQDEGLPTRKINLDWTENKE